MNQPTNQPTAPDTVVGYPDPEVGLVGLPLDQWRMLLAAARVGAPAFIPEDQDTLTARILPRIEAAITAAETEAATPLSPAGCTYVVTGPHGATGTDTLAAALAEAQAVLVTDQADVTITRRRD